MATLHIDLQEGWQGEEVLILLDGVQRWWLPEVTTRTQIGLAAQVGGEALSGSRTVEVIVPGRQLQATHEFEMGSEHWVAVSVTAGALVVKDQPAIFGYV